VWRKKLKEEIFANAAEEVGRRACDDFGYQRTVDGAQDGAKLFKQAYEESTLF
jgi:hypothetical protein